MAGTHAPSSFLEATTQPPPPPPRLAVSAVAAPQPVQARICCCICFGLFVPYDTGREILCVAVAVVWGERGGGGVQI